MPARSNNGPLSRLAAAASELLEAAGVETATRQQMQISSNVMAFKESIDAKLNTLYQTADSKLSSINETVGSLAQRINKVEESIASLEKCFSDYAKDQKITFALQNCHLKSFKYYEFDKNSYRSCISYKESEELVQDILLWFRRDVGFYIPNAALRQNFYSEGEFKASREEFKTKLIDKIHLFTGTKPRIALGSNNKDYVIYHS